MIKITKNLFLLPGKRTGGDSHVFVLNDGDGYILIDTGLTDKVRKIDPRKVKYVFLTHAHFDHIAQTWRFTNVYCSEKAFRYILERDEEIVCIKPEIKLPWFVPTGIVEDRQRIKTNRFSFRFIYAPSHTDDSMLIFEEVNGYLFTGDVLFAGGLVGRTDFKNSVREELDRVIRRILAIPWKLLCPGHGYLEKREIIKI